MCEKFGYLENRLKKINIEIERLTKVLSFRCRERKHIYDMLEQLKNPGIPGLEVMIDETFKNGFEKIS